MHAFQKILIPIYKRNLKISLNPTQTHHLNEPNTRHTITWSVSPCRHKTREFSAKPAPKTHVSPASADYVRLRHCGCFGCGVYHIIYLYSYMHLCYRRTAAVCLVSTKTTARSAASNFNYISAFQAVLCKQTKKKPRAVYFPQTRHSSRILYDFTHDANAVFCNSYAKVATRQVRKHTS